MMIMLGVVIEAALDGEKLKFPGTSKDPVILQLPPLIITVTSLTTLLGCPEATLS
jgi:hypothetical protein